MFTLLVLATLAVCVIAFAAAAWYYRDPLHPGCIFSLMLAVLYAGYPLYLESTNQFQLFLTGEDLVFIQRVILPGVFCLLLGTFVGSGRRRPGLAIPELDAGQRERLFWAATSIGLLGVVGYVLGILNVGGLDAAYGRAYGGGWSDSGYTRELFLLTLPAVLFLAVSQSGKSPALSALIMMAFCAVPLLAQGLLGARRGPTFMVTVGLAIAWYLMRRTRPRFSTVLLGGAMMGVLLLFLVSNRGAIYLGSDLQFTHSPLSYLEAGSGNEYIYGGANITHSLREDWYFWGRRQFIVLLIRPIPRGMWPQKYEDVSSFLDMEQRLDNSNNGLPTAQLLWGFGWQGAVGATPGIVADLWVDFWWFCLLALFLVGCFYGWSWRKSISRSAFWSVNFGIMMALSLYLIMQSVGEMVFRYLIMWVVSVAIWIYAIHGAATRQPGLRTPGLGAQPRQ